MNDWALAEVVRRATELYVERFPEPVDRKKAWKFPVLDLGGDFLIDPADFRAEADAVESRSL
ncbi:MAG: hypothetical protein WC314_18365 [Vulcanimicrobiota bacterium]